MNCSHFPITLAILAAMAIPTPVRSEAPKTESFEVRTSQRGVHVTFAPHHTTDATISLCDLFGRELTPPVRTVLSASTLDFDLPLPNPITRMAWITIELAGQSESKTLLPLR